MRFGLPWRVKGIRYEARETAEAAARRAGLPLNEWLNTVILQQAGGSGAKQPQAAERSDDRADDFSRVQLRLDDLTRRIEHVARKGPAAYAPKRNRYDTDQFADQVDRLEHRFYEVASHRPEPAAQGTQPPPILDRAVAEFTSRRRTLNGDETFVRPPDTTSALGGLEQQLRRITEQIETLKRPGIEEAIRTLRAELGDIGRALNDALPRNAIETLEMQIQVLAQRIAQGREAGVDGGALIGIENGLAEVRDALRDLMPAENLVGYNEAIKTLTQKIDLIVAERNPATMQQLERSLTTLRELSAHVASNDTVSRLSAQVQTLAEKIDGLAVGPHSEIKFENLASRIDALTRALAERTQLEIAAPQRLEALIQTLSEKIEQLQKSGADNIAAGHLENRIVKLMDRIDASNSRLDKLDAIERGLADLLVHIEELRANRKSTAIRAEGLGIDSVTQDIVYTRKSVDAVHRRLGDLFDRLAIIEQGIHAAGADKPATPKPETAQGDNFQFASPTHLVPAELSIALQLSNRGFTRPSRTSPHRQRPKRRKATISNLPTWQLSRRLNFRSLQHHRLKPRSCRKRRLRRIFFCQTPHRCQFPLRLLSQIVSRRRHPSPSSCPRINRSSPDQGRRAALRRVCGLRPRRPHSEERDRPLGLPPARRVSLRRLAGRPRPRARSKAPASRAPICAMLQLMRHRPCGAGSQRGSSRRC
jgi:localization factor PodJL